MPADPLVVVVAYHGAARLSRTLTGLGRLPVLVVDNSASAAVHGVVEDHPGADYLDAGGNLGFARAVNLGLAHAAGRDVVLVNPDAVVGSATVHALVARLHAGPRVAAVSPGLTDEQGAPQRVRWPFPTPAGAWLAAAGLARLQRDDSGFLVGAVLALRTDAVAEVGGFDPGYFLYAEETDWQRRAVAAGWTLVRADELVATHVGGATSRDEARREVHFHAGTERYVRRWHGPRGWASYRAAVVLGGLARGLVLRGERGAAARRRVALYRRGPLRREAELVPR